MFTTWSQITRGNSITGYGGETPQWQTYPNGSRLYFAGMDNPQKALSSERDLIYVNQAEELLLHDWEVLSTRCTGRAGNAPYSQLMGDCNPGPPNHWIRGRASLEFLDSRHEDNPTLYADDGSMTEQGRRTMAVLDALTGIRLQRLRYGKWAQVEGAVYDDYDQAIHVVPRFDIPREWPRLWVVDFGYRNPLCWQAWAKDPDGRLVMYREIYQTERIVRDHARDILKVTEGEPRPRLVLCDHDAEDRATFERETGIRTKPAYKALGPGIQAVQERLRPTMSGSGELKPRITFMENSLVLVDKSLLAAHRPTCTTGEFEEYCWPTGMDGRAVKETPVDQNNHGMDCVRYVVAEEDLQRRRMARMA